MDVPPHCVPSWFKSDHPCRNFGSVAGVMRDNDNTPGTKSRTTTKPKTERPRLYKVILINDDYTPREFVVKVLAAVFGMGEAQSHRVMMTAHQRGVCVVAVYARDIAETKANEATELGRQHGHPLTFSTEPEE